MVAEADIVKETQGSDSHWSQLFSRDRLVTTAFITLTTALFAFSALFVSAAMPTAVAEFSKPWLLPSAFIAFLVFSTTCGAAAAAVGRRFGMRTPLVVANVLFILGCILAASAVNPWELLVGRSLQGIGEGMAVALAYILIPQVYSGGQIARVFGLESAVWAVAAFAAPATAGALTQYVSWRAPFLIGVPAAVVLIILSLYLPGRKVGNATLSRVPWLQLSLLATAILVMSLASMTSIIQAAILLAGAFGLVALFVRADRAAGERVLPGDAFSKESIVADGIGVLFFMMAAEATVAVYFIYGIMQVGGLEPLAASLVGSLLALSWSFVAFGVSNLSNAARERCIHLGGPLVVLGCISVLAGIFWSSIVVAGFGQAIIGAAFGVTWGPLSQVLMERTSETERDRMSALLPPLQSVGAAIGAAVLGFLASVNGMHEGASSEVIHKALIVVFAGGVAFSVLAAFFTFRLGRKSRGRG